jgi:hypothetical protein
VARRTGLPLEVIRRRIVAGAVPTRTVERDGQLEVRVAADDVSHFGGGSAASTMPPQSGPRTAGAGVPEQPAPEVARSGADLAPSPTGTSLSPGSLEIRELAAGLADELFQRWELSMQEQFREELKVRLQSELEHRRRQTADLQEEVEQRAQGRFGPRGTRVMGMADRYATWERERTLTRQSRELAELERQMAEMRQRLEELGLTNDEATLTVDRKSTAQLDSTLADRASQAESPDGQNSHEFPQSRGGNTIRP